MSLFDHRPVVAIVDRVGDADMKGCEVIVVEKSWRVELRPQGKFDAMQNRQKVESTTVTAHFELIDRLTHVLLLQQPCVPALKRRFSEMIEIYAELTRIQDGFPPTPNMLLGLGEAASVIHAVTCRRKGAWAVFRDRVAARHPGIPRPTSRQAKDGTILKSVAEVFAYETLRRISLIERITIHPLIDSERRTSHEADFLVRNKEKTAFMEVAMVRRDPMDDNSFEQRYRKLFDNKLKIYRTRYGKLPTIIWADELAPPRLIKERTNELLVHLGQAPLPIPLDVLPTLKWV